MNLRCTYCQTPFTVSRLEKLVAIQHMQAENLHHYDIFCPRCRRANSVSRQRLEIFTPGWQEGLKTLEADAARIEKERTEPVPAPLEVKPTPAAVEPTRNRHISKPSVAAPPPAESKPVAKPVAKAKSAPKEKPAAKAKPAVRKAVAKAKPAAAKAKTAAKKPVKKAAPAAKKTAAKSKPATKAKKAVKKR